MSTLLPTPAAGPLRVETSMAPLIPRAGPGPLYLDKGQEVLGP